MKFPFAIDPSTSKCLRKRFASVEAKNALLSDEVLTFTPESKQVIQRKSLKEKFYESLPVSFDRSTFHKIAETLSIPGRTADGYIAWFIKSSMLFRDQHNFYTKK